MDDTISLLSEILDSVPPRLRAITEPQSIEPRIEGKWCTKEVLGHLIDSASNNHQRFVRAQLASEYEGPGYTQNEWVRTQAYTSEPWANLVDLWTSYNRHLLHVIKAMDPAALGRPCRIGGGEPVTLKFVVTDYLAHLQNHLKQILP